MKFSIEARRALSELGAAKAEVRAALQRSEEEDEAIAKLYGAEDGVLALPHSSPRMRLVQADIRLRRLGVVAESAEARRDIEEIRYAIGDAVEALDKAKPSPSPLDGLPMFMSGHCFGRQPDGVLDPDITQHAAA